MGQVFTGILGIISGFLVIVYVKQIKEFFGNIAWAEQHLGTGGTFSFFKLLGVALIIISFAYMTGTIQDLFNLMGLNKVFMTGS